MRTAGEANRQNTSNWDQARSDINVLAQRVTGIENGLASLSSDLRLVSTKLDAKPTNWLSVAAAAAAVLSVVGGFLLQGKQPIDTALDRHDREITKIVDTAVDKDDFREFKRESSNWNLSLRDRLRSDEDNAVTQRQITELEARLDEHHRLVEGSTSQILTDLKARVDAIDGQLIKRPEIQSIVDGINSRINSIIVSINDIRHDVGANYTLGDVVKSLIERLDRVQTQLLQFSATPPQVMISPSRNSETERK